MLTAILQKQVIFQNIKNAHESLPFVVESEIEHAFLLCRSIYDEIHHVVSDIASLLRTVEGEKIVTGLPRSFAKISLDGDNVRSVSEINSKWKIPIPIAEMYFSHAETFQQIRDIRVSIEHSGKRVPDVFHTEQGFAIS